jgi:hypothetical protein
MLTINRKIIKFLTLVIGFSIIVSMISYLINNAHYEIAQKSNDYRSLGFMRNLIAASCIIFIVSILFYLLKLIPQVRYSINLGGLLVFLLSYVIMTGFMLMGSIAPFDPFSKEYLYGFVLRFGITCLIPYVDYFLTKRLAA